MKKITFIFPSFSGGGAERVASILASNLSKDFEVSVVAYFPVENNYFISSSVKVNYLTNSKEEYRNLSLFKKIRLLRILLLKITPEVVFPFLPQVGFHTYIACWHTKIKIVQTVRNNPKIDPESKFRRIIRDLTLRRSWKNFVQNQAQFDYFSKGIKNKTVIIPNPINDSFFNFPDDEIVYGKPSFFHIVALGRLCKQKNFEMLISTAKMLENIPNISIDIYGDGELKSQLLEKIREEGLVNVKINERTDSPEKVLKESDIFVLPSLYEGMPNALLEAMASSKICISTDCETGPRDIIQSGINGFLIPVNDVQKLYETILCVIHMSDNDYLSMRNAAYKTAKDNYSIENVLKIFKSEFLS